MDKGRQYAFKIPEGYIFINQKPFNLVKHGCVGQVGITSIDPPGCDDAQGRLARLHHSDLHRRGVSAQKQSVVEVERIVHGPRRMAFGHVERGEIMPVVLDLGTRGDRKTEVGKNLRQLVHHLADQSRVAAGKRRVIRHVVQRQLAGMEHRGDDADVAKLVLDAVESRHHQRAEGEVGVKVYQGTHVYDNNVSRDENVAEFCSILANAPLLAEGTATVIYHDNDFYGSYSPNQTGIFGISVQGQLTAPDGESKRLSAGVNFLWPEDAEDVNTILDVLINVTVRLN